MKCRPAAIGFVLLLVAGAGFTVAQEDRGGEPLDPGLEERTGVYLVELEILALDRQGRPVRDLQAEDLVVKEHGTPQQIVVFEKHLKGPPEGPRPGGSHPLQRA